MEKESDLFRQRQFNYIMTISGEEKEEEEKGEEGGEGREKEGTVGHLEDFKSNRPPLGTHDQPTFMLSSVLRAGFIKFTKE